MTSDLIAQGWIPIAEQTPPEGEWLRTKLEGEASEGIAFWRRMNMEYAAGDEVEWVDMSGYTTVTHGTYAAPSHWMHLPHNEGSMSHWQLRKIYPNHRWETALRSQIPKE